MSTPRPPKPPTQLEAARLASQLEPVAPTPPPPAAARPRRLVSPWPADAPPPTLRDLLGELVGAASMCWQPTPDGTFDPDQANAWLNQAADWIDTHYQPRPHPAQAQTCPRCDGAGLRDAGPGTVDQPCTACSGTGQIRPYVLAPTPLPLDTQQVELEHEQAGMRVHGLPRASGANPL